MPPSARTIWVSPQAQAEWESRIQRAAAAYWRLEKETVRAGIRRCTTGHMNPERLPLELADLAKQGLVFLPRLAVGSYQGFAHSHPKVEAGKPWNWYGPIAASISDALAFVEAEQHGDHDTIGELLGYPQCCREFFRTVWMAGYIDPVWQAAQRTNAGSVLSRTDYLIELKGEELAHTWSGSRYNGLRLAPHIPCSFSCEETHERVSEWLQLGRQLNIPGIDDLVALLNMPVEWNALHGVALVTTPIYRVVTNTVACHPKHVVRKHGEFIPKEAATGLIFPFAAKTKQRLPLLEMEAQ